MAKRQRTWTVATVSTMSIEAALAALDQHRLEAAEVVPEGWYTVQDLAAARGVCADAMGRKLRAAGARFEKRKFRVKVGDQVRPLTHYRLK